MDGTEFASARRRRDGRADAQQDDRPGFGDNTSSNVGQLYFVAANQTLAGSGTVEFGKSASNALFAQGNGSSISVQLTVDAGIQIQGLAGAITGFYPAHDTTILNGTIDMGAQPFALAVNEIGAVTAAGTGQVTLSGTGSTISAASFNVGAGSVVVLAATVNNTGNALTVSGSGTLELTGTLTGGTVNLSGAALQLYGGTIQGSTLANGSGGTLVLTSFGGMLAGGVTIGAGVTVDATQGHFTTDYAIVTGGLTLNGTIDLGSSNGSSSTAGTLDFEGGNQALTGNGTVVFGSDESSNALFAEGNGSSISVALTIGAGITIQGGSGNVNGVYGADSIILDGSIAADNGGDIIVGNGLASAKRSRALHPFPPAIERKSTSTNR